MNQLGILTKAPLPIVIDGQHYFLSPPELNDLGELSHSMQFRKYEMLLNANMPETVKNELLQKVWLDCAEKKTSMDDLEAYVASPDGMTELLYLSLRHHHKDITLEKVKSFSMNAFAEATTKVGELLAPAGQKKSQVTADIQLSPSNGPNSINT